MTIAMLKIKKNTALISAFEIILMRVDATTGECRSVQKSLLSVYIIRGCIVTLTGCCTLPSYRRA